MVIVAAAQTQWKSPRILNPVLSLGRNSYEVYLLHMFVVFALFNLFVSVGKPMAAVPVLFVAVTLFSGALGVVAARFHSNPMNRLLRKRSSRGDLGSVIEDRPALEAANSPG
jgi:peptidoglycan/LPS O-acetylase OafA/YrhL